VRDLRARRPHFFFVEIGGGGKRAFRRFNGDRTVRVSCKSVSLQVQGGGS